MSDSRKQFYATMDKNDLRLIIPCSYRKLRTISRNYSYLRMEPKIYKRQSPRVNMSRRNIKIPRTLQSGKVTTYTMHYGDYSNQLTITYVKRKTNSQHVQ